MFNKSPNNNKAHYLYSDYFNENIFDEKKANSKKSKSKKILDLNCENSKNKTN